MKTFYKVMLWLHEFELAFTPPSAKCYAQLKVDIMHWQGKLHCAEVKGL